MKKTGSLHTPEDSDVHLARTRAGTQSLANLDLRLTHAEAQILRATDRLTLGMFVAEQDTANLPPSLPRFGGEELVRLGGLPLPRAHATRVQQLSGAVRQQVIRAALHRLSDEHQKKRWELVAGRHPGTPQERSRISVGPGRWVARAVWRRSSDGMPRQGYGGAGTVMLANGALLPGSLGDLYELVDADWNVIEVFEAQSLHDAAYQILRGTERRTLPASRLHQSKETLKRGVTPH